MLLVLCTHIYNTFSQNIIIIIIKKFQNENYSAEEEEYNTSIIYESAKYTNISLNKF